MKKFKELCGMAITFLGLFSMLIFLGLSLELHSELWMVAFFTISPALMILGFKLSE
jgi:hypothetical protein